MSRLSLLWIAAAGLAACQFPTANSGGPDADPTIDAPEGSCGDGVHQPPGEACDDGNQVPGDGCENDCSLTIDPCGNMVLDEGEECDDGNQVPADGCENDCTESDPNCGNGTHEPELGEECDDNNLESGDGCDGNCTITACGNNVPAGSEECDDGNDTEGDGCDSNCTFSACGNGIIAANEVCDSGAAVGTGLCVGGPDEGNACDAVAACALVPSTISFVAAQNMATTGDSQTLSVDLQGTTDRAVVVAVTIETSTSDTGRPSAITLDGVAMAQAVTRNEDFGGSRLTSTLYYLTEGDLPAAGSTVDLVVTAANTTDTMVTVIQIDGVDGAGPDVTSNSSAFALGVLVNAITTLVDGAMLVDAQSVQTTATLVPDATQTERSDFAQGSTQAGTSTKVVAQASLTGTSWTITSGSSIFRTPNVVMSLPPAMYPAACTGCNATCDGTALP